MSLELSEYWFLKLKVTGWMAQFRDPYTITSKLTLLIPSKSTLIGMILAKRGLLKLKEDQNLIGLYQYYKEKISVAIAYQNNKVTKYLDYLSYRDNELQQKPTFVEYLMNPSYEIIYFFPKKDDYNLLGENSKKQILENEFFKMYFGSNDFPVYIEEINEIDVEKIKIKKTFESKFLLSTDFMIKHDIEPVFEKHQKKYMHSILLKSFPHEEKHEREICLLPLGEKIKFKIKNKELELFNIKEENELFMVF